MIFVFEGTDKSGKTSLINKINEETNYTYWILDRSFISSIVYTKLFKRDNLDIWYKRAKELLRKNEFMFILCKCNSNIIKERLMKCNETLSNELLNIDYVYEVFKNTLDELKCNYIIVNTEEDINKLTKELINIIEANEVSI